jgi:hypothetical protein
MGLAAKADAIIDAALPDATETNLANAIMEAGLNRMQAIADIVFAYNPMLAGVSFYNPTPGGMMYIRRGEDKGARVGDISNG